MDERNDDWKGTMNGQFESEAQGKAERMRSTTVVAVLRDGRIAVAADGQVTLGETVMKQRAEKVRRIGKGQALIGFAGGAADALTLMERLETKLESHPGNVRRAAVELARDWRTDRVLRKLEAMILLGDAETLLMVSGNGDVIEPDLPAGVAVIPDGPLWVSGGIEVTRADGTTLETRNRVTLCRCGQSGSKPLCDGSHKAAGFTG